MEALRKYEEDVRELKKLHPAAATEHIPDTVHVITKSDFEVYTTHEGEGRLQNEYLMVLFDVLWRVDSLIVNLYVIPWIFWFDWLYLVLCPFRVVLA